MYSLLEAANRQPLSTAARDQSPAARASVVEFDRSAGNSITAGCYLAGTSTGTIPPAVLSKETSATHGAAFAEEAFGARQPNLGTNGKSRKRANPGAGPVAAAQSLSSGAIGNKESASRKPHAGKSRDAREETLHSFQVLHRHGAASGLSPPLLRMQWPERPPPALADTNESVSGLCPSSDDEVGGLQPTATATAADYPVSEKRRRADTASPKSPEIPPRGKISIADKRVGSEGSISPPSSRDYAVDTTSNKPSPVLNGLLVSPTDSSFMPGFKTHGPTSLLADVDLSRESSHDRPISVKQQALPGNGDHGASPTRRKQQHRPRKQDGTMKDMPHASSKNQKQHQGGGTGGNANDRTASNAQSLLSQRLEGIMAAYSNTTPVVSAHAAAEKREAVAAKARIGKRARGDGGQPSRPRGKAGMMDGTGGTGSSARWRQAETTVAAVSAAAKAADRTKQLEALMNAAMESPITYEEQIRRERLAHLRMMYTVTYKDCKDSIHRFLCRGVTRCKLRLEQTIA